MLILQAWEESHVKMILRGEFLDDVFYHQYFTFCIQSWHDSDFEHEYVGNTNVYTEVDVRVVATSNLQSIKGFCCHTSLKCDAFFILYY